MPILPGSEVTPEALQRLNKFVYDSTQHFDSSHNWEHANAVDNNLQLILNGEGVDYEEDILIYTAKLHDVRDHKYPNSISESQLTNFLDYQVGIEKRHRIINLIENISWSKEIKLGNRIGAEREDYLIFLRDADRLEALGQIGLDRCITLTRVMGGKVPEDVIQHCHDKLLRLYPEGFIRSKTGRRLAEPLHQVIVEYVREN